MSTQKCRSKEQNQTAGTHARTIRDGSLVMDCKHTYGSSFEGKLSYFACGIWCANLCRFFQPAHGMCPMDLGKLQYSMYYMNLLKLTGVGGHSCQFFVGTLRQRHVECIIV
jgi:hypothetical protein